MSATATAPPAAAALERPQNLDERVLGMELPSVVSELVAHLGGANVAIIGGVSKTSLVAEWMRGVRPKSEDRAMRLRLALRLALIVGSLVRKSVPETTTGPPPASCEDVKPYTLLPVKYKVGELTKL